MSDSKDAYREELSAAHARIASLEAELAGAGVDPKIKELEKQRQELVDTTGPKRFRGFLWKLFFLPIAVFGGIGAVAAAVTRQPEPLALAVCGLVISVLVTSVHYFVTPNATKQQIAKIDRELEEAQRIARLEKEVKETRRLLEGQPQVRVETESVEPGEPVDEKERKLHR